eukprot:scaffold266_cov391-Prasinococcus_capsulatus_cf.AAC.48
MGNHLLTLALFLCLTLNRRDWGGTRLRSCSRSTCKTSLSRCSCCAVARPDTASHGSREGAHLQPADSEAHTCRSITREAIMARYDNEGTTLVITPKPDDEPP